MASPKTNNVENRSPRVTKSWEDFVRSLMRVVYVLLYPVYVLEKDPRVYPLKTGHSVGVPLFIGAPLSINLSIRTLRRRTQACRPAQDRIHSIR